MKFISKTLVSVSQRLRGTRNGSPAFMRRRLVRLCNLSPSRFNSRLPPLSAFTADHLDSSQLEYTMIGSLLNRGLVLIFGYAYPAYECFKSVENKPHIEQLCFWCQYWILVAMLTVCERIGDTFIPWLPMYSEAKLAFYIYLWHPRTKGTSYVYDSFFKPYVSKHETEIDRNIMELKTKAGDIVVIYLQKAASYGQTRVFDILQYVASQSTPTPKSHNSQNQNTDRQEPPSNSTSSQHPAEIVQEVSSTTAALAIYPAPSATRFLPAPANSTSTLKNIAQQSDPESSNESPVKKTSSKRDL